jgi:hypothetical protein
MAFTQISTDGIKNGTITGSDLATNIDLVDNQKLRFGTGNDLQIYHDGSNSFIKDAGTGRLFVPSSHIQFRNAAHTETMAEFIENDAVQLYYDNAKKFETTSDGVKISGAEGVEAILTFEPDEGDNASDKFRFRASDSAGFFLENGSSNDTSIKANFNGEVELYYGGTKKFQTTSGGAKVTGLLESEGNVSSTTQFSGFQGLRIQNANGAALGVTADINFVAGTGSDNRGAVIGVEITSGFGNDLYFATNPNSVSNNDTPIERLRITSDGKVDLNASVAKIGNSHSSGTTYIYGHDIRFTNEDITSTKLVIDSSGRVLIGGATTSQGSTNADDLQVGASGQSNQTGITLGSAVASSLRFMDAANDSAGYIFYNHGTDDMTIAATNSVTLSEAGTVRFSTHSNGVIISGFTDVRQDSTSAYSASAAPGNLLARFYNGSAQSNSMASIQLRAANDNGAADLWYMTCVAQAQNYNGFLAFSTRTSASVYQEVARMTNGRSFLVGTTAHLNLGANNVTGIVLEHNGRITACRNGSAALHVGRQGDNGEAVLFACQGTSIVGSINVTTTSATLQSGSSDRTMKKNFEDWTEDTLSLFKNIKPQKFNFIIEDDGAEKTKGYIAQDLVDSFPEAYPKNSEGKYMFSPQGMVVYLMKAIQELEAEVAALKAA